jgi:hypothetical protein
MLRVDYGTPVTVYLEPAPVEKSSNCTLCSCFSVAIKTDELNAAVISFEESNRVEELQFT